MDKPVKALCDLPRPLSSMILSYSSLLTQLQQHYTGWTFCRSTEYMPSPSSLTICASYSSRQSNSRLAFSRWKKSWQDLGAIKMRLQLYLLFSMPLFRWYHQSSWLYLMSRLWRFLNVYLQPQTFFSMFKQAVSSQEAMEAWYLNLHPWFLLVWITPNLSEQVEFLFEDSGHQ